MPARRLPWFRIWMDATTHEKVRQLTDAEFRTWVELLDAASKQTWRGRFSNRSSAASLVRRPKAHVGRLISARLIDEDSDEHLTMHDWDEWQRWRKEDPIDDEPPPDHQSNDSRTSTEQHANVNGTTRDHSLAGARAREEERREKRDTEIDRDVDVDVDPPAPAERPPTQIGKPTKARRPISKDTIERLVAEYGPQFGDDGTVRDWITRALNHTARLKALDEALYVERTWLKPELAKLKAREDHIADELEPASAPTVPKRWQTCSTCGRRGNYAISDEPLCGGCGDKQEQRGAA